MSESFDSSFPQEDLDDFVRLVGLICHDCGEGSNVVRIAAGFIVYHPVGSAISQVSLFFSDGGITSELSLEGIKHA